MLKERLKTPRGCYVNLYANPFSAGEVKTEQGILTEDKKIMENGNAIGIVLDAGCWVAVEIPTLWTRAVSKCKIGFMKPSIYLFLAISFLSLSCEEVCVDHPSEGTCGIRVKVIHALCADMFLEIQDEKYYSLGDADWQFADGRKTKPVFVVANFCDFGRSLPGNTSAIGKEFEVTQVDGEYKNDCMVCAAIYGHEFPKKMMAVQLCTETVD